LSVPDFTHEIPTRPQNTHERTTRRASTHGKRSTRQTKSRSINITRDFLDQIRNEGGTGQHRDIYDHQQGFMVRVTPAGVVSFATVTSRDAMALERLSKA
jgi:hypothetical protein